MAHQAQGSQETVCTPTPLYADDRYNPVLGEFFRCTYNYPDGSEGLYIAEQVSHHPVRTLDRPPLTRSPSRRSFTSRRLMAF
jgi:hypothetical protein